VLKMMLRAPRFKPLDAVNILNLSKSLSYSRLWSVWEFLGSTVARFRVIPTEGPAGPSGGICVW
jgi:hypothetical protein